MVKRKKFRADGTETVAWEWIEWVTLRAQMVDALFLAATHDSDDGQADPSCTSFECCLPLAKLADRCGIELGGKDDNRPFRYADRYDEGTTSEMRDGLSILSVFYMFKSLAEQNVFEGFLEVPKAVGDIIHSDYFRGLEQRMNNGEDLVERYNREIVHALVELAFPDEFLEHVDPLNVENVPGPHNYARFVRILSDAGYETPTLTDGMVADLSSDFQAGMGRVWDPLAPYMLDAAFNSEVDGQSGLDLYWNDLLTIPWTFAYAERSNGYSTFMSFLVREWGVFLSQQMFDGTWNAATRAYNTHMAPIIEPGHDDGIMVIFSEFRGDAYIVSTIEESWDEYAPHSRVLEPVPAGFGIVGVWSGYEENRYMPRPLDEIIRNNYSNRITAAARYLRDCLAATQRED